MKHLISIILLLFVGCSQEIVKNCYNFSFYDNGNQIGCTVGYWSSCGYNLKSCSDNNEYDCVSNVIIKTLPCKLNVAK